MRETIAISLVLLGLSSPALAEDPWDVLRKVDEAAAGKSDSTMVLSLEVTRRGSVVARRRVRVWQLGEDRRMLKVLEPKRLRGVGLLNAGPGEVFMYLPAFGRVRRMVGPDKDDRFLGTDFSVEDLSRTRFSGDYTPSIQKETKDGWVLRLTPVEGRGTHELLVSVTRPGYLFTRVVVLGEGGEVLRIISLGRFEEVQGRTIARQVTVEVPGTGRRTDAHVDEVRLDVGLDPGFFSRRYLERDPGD